MAKDRVLITGGSGFLGRNLAIKLKEQYDVYLGARNNKQNFNAQGLTGVSVLPMDVSSMESTRDAIRSIRPNVIIHAAATKFVDLSEKFPLETIDVNVVGSENVARAAMDYGVDVVIGISTDKACPPIRNIYGLSKATMERMFCLLDGKTRTKFACVRYGNVAWSTGSVLPIWKKMQQEGKVIGTTGPDMRRFFFTVDDAVQLVETAINNINTIRGQILSRNMKAALIRDLLNVWVEEFGGEWALIEGRPGERNDEYLVGETELEYCRVLDFKGVQHFLISPNTKVDKPFPYVFTSREATKLTRQEMVAIIKAQPDTL